MVFCRSYLIVLFCLQVVRFVLCCFVLGWLVACGVRFMVGSWVSLLCF